MREAITLIGAPGAGKGTQADLITKNMGYEYCSIGDILREAAKTDKELCDKMKTGHLLDIELIERVFTESLKNKQGPILLDGVPRNMDQVEMVDRVLQNTGFSLTKAILIDVSDEEIKRRILNRWLCLEDGKTKILSGSKESVSLQCKGELSKRSDDTESIVERRLSVFKSETFPIISIFEERGILFHINGERKPLDIFEEIKGILND